VSVYMIIEVQILDHTRYSEYVERVPEIIRKYGGRYLVRGGRITPVSQTWNPERIVVIEFETMDGLRACFSSPEYLEIAPFREGAIIGKSIVVEGNTEN
jgi:uncharacterized protein (DUF1330 family)